MAYEVRGSALPPTTEISPLAEYTVSALLPETGLDVPDDLVPSADSMVAAEVEAIFRSVVEVSVSGEKMLPESEVLAEMTVAPTADSTPVGQAMVDSILEALSLDGAEPQWIEAEHIFLHLSTSAGLEGEFFLGDGVNGRSNNQWSVPTSEDDVDSLTAAPAAQASDLLADFILSAERADPVALNPRTEEPNRGLPGDKDHDPEAQGLARGASANGPSNFFGEDSGEEVVSAIGFSGQVAFGVGELATDTGADEVVPTIPALPGQFADLLASIVPISLTALDAVIEHCGDTIGALDEGMRFNLGLLMAALAVAAVAGEITRREMQRLSSQQVSAPGGGEPMVA